MYSYDDLQFRTDSSVSSATMLGNKSDLTLQGTLLKALSCQVDQIQVALEIRRPLRRRLMPKLPSHIKNSLRNMACLRIQSIS